MKTCLTVEFPTETNLLCDKSKKAKLFAKAIQDSLGDSFVPRIFRNSNFTLAEDFEEQAGPMGASPNMKLEYQVGNEKFSLTVYLDKKKLEIDVSNGGMLPNYGKIKKLQDKLIELTDAVEVKFFDGKSKPIEDLREWIKQKRMLRPA
jgi:hypothetical protein